MTVLDRRNSVVDTTLVERAISLQPLLRQHAGFGEHNRQTADEVIDAMTDAGLFRLGSPTRFGGFAAGARTRLSVTEALGEADGSAAWLVAIASDATWIVGHAPERLQQEVFGAGADARLAGGISPVHGHRVDGGIQVTGRWPFASGAPHADWAGIGVLLTDDSGHAAPYLCVVPASEMRIDDTWQTAGMRGTGSHSWAAENLFIPEHRILSLSTVTEGGEISFGALGALNLLGPILGMGRGALALAIGKAPTKALQHTFFARQSDSVGVQIQVAEAALKLQTARLHGYQAADELDGAVADGTALGFDGSARIRAQCGYAVQQVLAALNILVNVHGAGSFAESNRMQQYWRDANTAARHAGLNATVGYEIFGKSLLGVQERISTMI